ncbi:cold-regulated protein 27 [Mercurialis annua]|uniref:cold-regulated protein 27 n=1 Tax=Mercurialis annua TaxID=3986 RepID=UPI00215EC3EB|nr:cold-regulated protein 27 [Mercurialis annua]
MDSCRTETRTISSGADSVESAQHDSQITESLSTEWTDEKHRLYLKSMEASFVNQLYNSMDLLDLRLKKEMPEQQVHPNTCTPSGQFKVLRGGSWQNVNFQKPESQVNVDILGSPWIQHFRSARKPHVTVQERGTLHKRATNSSGKKAVSSGIETCSNHSYTCCRNSCQTGAVDSTAEVSDQNFVDENISSSKTSSTWNSKKIKTKKSRTSINDQVVPYSKPPAAEKNTEVGRDDSLA